jgi:hypothetical protein
MTTLHLCIATGQNAANFIPLKQLKAQEVWILETPAMKAQRSGADLKQALEADVPSVKCLPFNDSTPESICASAAKLANDSLDGRDVVFHITGGTKLMVLAIHRELENLNSNPQGGSYRTLYADTLNHTLDWLDAKPVQEPMADVLTLQDLLLVRGYRITNNTLTAKDQQRAALRAAVSRHMGDQAQVLSRFFSTLAYKASMASEGNSLTQHFDYPPGGPAAKLLNLAVKNGLLQWGSGSGEITFTDRDSARFFAGGWTEEYVFLKMSFFKPGQYAMNAKVIQNRTKTENEIDAIAVKNNRALLIECKSGKQVKAQDSIYKLGQVVRQVGGLMAKGLYISAQQVNEADRSRAAEYGIDVLAGEELQNVNQYLRDWAKA